MSNEKGNALVRTTYNTPQSGSERTRQSRSLRTPLSESVKTSKSECLTTPESEGFRTPRSEGFRTPRSEGFRTPRSEGFRTPRSEGFSTPRSEGFITPLSESVKISLSESLTTPESEGFRTPRSEGFKTPQSDGFKTPQSDGFRTPRLHHFRTPESENGKYYSRHGRSSQSRNKRIGVQFGGRKRTFSDTAEFASSNFSEFSSRAKRRRFSSPFLGPHDVASLFPHPTFKSYQLVGDSLLLRFAEQCQGLMARYENGLRFLGLCVSGQTIQELTERVRKNFAPLGQKVILLIGTNNILRNADVEIMKTALAELVGELTKTVKKLVLLTLPPIPKLENDGKFWYKFNQYNKFLNRLSKELDNVFCENISDLFYDRHHKCDMNFFESWYDRQQRRADRIHLNKAGNMRLQEKLSKSQSLNEETENADTY